MTSIADDTRDYDAWLRTQCQVDEKTLRMKHKIMREDVFRFLRATYYRWARRVDALLPDLADAPRALCVGDIHVENFGAWRDGDGRLVWGVNDFDEAAEMPFAYDLVRLVTSIRLAPAIGVGKRAVADAVLEGYEAGLEAPRPTLPDEHDLILRREFALLDSARSTFWEKIAALPDAKPPAPIARALSAHIPDGAQKRRYASRVAGAGSLGRPRYVLIATWHGGTIVREAKSLVPSAWDWAHRLSRPSRYTALSHGAYRSPDPWLGIDEAARVVVRRLSASARKIELTDLRNGMLREHLIRGMGFDLGAIHAATPRKVPALKAFLTTQPRDWLHTAARTMQSAIEDDHAHWRG